jgi:type IV pilus assembly protein PilF
MKRGELRHAVPARWLAALAVVVLGGLNTGCVTTVDGVSQQPASQAQRVQAQLALARGHIETGDWQSARQPLERALEIDARSSDAHALLALVYQAEGSYGRAEESYRRALRFNRDNALALNNFGTFLFLQQRHGEARQMLLRAVEDTAYHARPQAYENLALVELALGEPARASDALERALRLNPDLPRAHLELADLQLARGDHAAALEHYARFRRLASQTPRSLWLGIRLSQAVRDRDAAASYALQLRNMFPGSDEYRLYQDAFE